MKNKKAVFAVRAKIFLTSAAVSLALFALAAAVYSYAGARKSYGGSPSDTAPDGACGISRPPSLPDAPPLGEECPPGMPEDFFETVAQGFEYQEKRVFINGEPYPYIVTEHADELYAEPDKFISAVCSAESCRDAEKLSVTSDSLIFECRVGDVFVRANGRCLFCRNGVCEDFGAVTSPVSVIAEALGLGVRESDGDLLFEGEASFLESADSYYCSEDLYWLSRIISCESMSESFLGKIAVGNVVMNRAASPDFPNDVKGVVFDSRYGIVQFSPVSGGYIYNDPDPESVDAAKLCLEGVSLSDTILYFMNPALADTTWISDNREAVMTIGRHTFYS